MRERERHRLDVEVVAKQHRDVIAPLRVDRQPAAAHIRIVDDVVVDERRGMDKLHDRRVEHGAVAAVAAEPCRHQQHRGANPLSAARLNVLADAGNQINLRLDVPAEFRVDPLEVFTDGFEDVGEVESGVLHEFGASRHLNTITGECQRAGGT